VSSEVAKRVVFIMAQTDLLRTVRPSAPPKSAAVRRATRTPGQFYRQSLASS